MFDLEPAGAQPVENVTQTTASDSDLLDAYSRAVIGAVESIPRARRKDLDMVQEAIRRAVRAAANHAWGKKPVVTAFLTKV